ncbi:hypothetical protein TNCV_677611 [Trichonephila clavipes]|nr:hypothetical protein TNCV_677611 [Trichonephila clavipes]
MEDMGTSRVSVHSVKCRRSDFYATIICNWMRQSKHVDIAVDAPDPLNLTAVPQTVHFRSGPITMPLVQSICQNFLH